MCFRNISRIFFFFNDTPSTEIYTLSLHDALPIWPAREGCWARPQIAVGLGYVQPAFSVVERSRSEEHTSELQSHHDIVCRLLLEKKKRNKQKNQKPRTHPKRQ